MVNGHRGAGAALALGSEPPSFADGQDTRQERERERFGRMVGQSPPMRAVFDTLERAAAATRRCCWKARRHRQGDLGRGGPSRSDGATNRSWWSTAARFRPSCWRASSSDTTGIVHRAVSSRQGVFEAAGGGTVFLDEIGELSIDLQPKLLRVLERREVRRIGTNQHIPVNVRLVAATNRALKDQVAARKFRSDLYYRLAVVEIRLPPLRERISDLPLLVEHIARTMAPLAADTVQTIHSGDFLRQAGQARLAGQHPRAPQPPGTLHRPA